MKVERITLILVFFLIIYISCSNDDSLPPGELDISDIPGSIILEENVILDKNKRIVNIVLSQSEYLEVISENNFDYTLVTNKFYKHFKDDFDFIFICPNVEENLFRSFSGRVIKPKNDIQGIGEALFDNSIFFGSNGRLEGISFLTQTNAIVEGPILHEIVHIYGNFNFIPTSRAAHWGHSSVGGQLGGFDNVTDLGDGRYKGDFKGSPFSTFANGGNMLPFADLELYLMGVLEFDELEPIQVAENPVDVDVANGIFTADSLRTITPEDLVAEHGPRVPSAKDAQKSFNAVCIIISTSEMKENLALSVDQHLENFAKEGVPDPYWEQNRNFWQATKARATLNIGIIEENIK